MIQITGISNNNPTYGHKYFMKFANIKYGSRESTAQWQNYDLNPFKELEPKVEKN